MSVVFLIEYLGASRRVSCFLFEYLGASRRVFCFLFEYLGASRRVAFERKKFWGASRQFSFPSAFESTEYISEVLLDLVLMLRYKFCFGLWALAITQKK